MGSEMCIRDRYEYLREQAKGKSQIKMMDYGTIFAGKTALEILRQMVGGYDRMNQQEQMLMFYKVIYSERCIQPMAAKIMAEETERMILATKQLFYAMEIHKILHFQDADMSAVSFAMTVHGLMDYGLDKQTGKYEAADRKKDLMDEYLKWFCEENAVERNCEDTKQRV